MSRLILISLFVLLNTVNLSAQKVDTLFSGLKKANSFLLANDAIYIVETGNHRVLKLDINGKLLEKYGNKGSSNYQFDTPVSITSYNGLKIFVSDLGNERIQVFDKRWQYLSSITGNQKFQTSDRITPSFSGVNKLGEIVFYDSEKKALLKFDEDGTYLDRIPLPSEIKAVDGLQVLDNKIFVHDGKSGFIHRLSDNGFYETFYPAKTTTAFSFNEETLYLVQNGVIISSNGQEVNELFNQQKTSTIKQLIFLKEKLYVLTQDQLIQISVQ